MDKISNEFEKWPDRCCKGKFDFHILFVIWIDYNGQCITNY